MAYALLSLGLDSAIYTNTYIQNVRIIFLLTKILFATKTLEM